MNKVVEGDLRVFTGGRLKNLALAIALLLTAALLLRSALQSGSLVMLNWLGFVAFAALAVFVIFQLALGLPILTLSDQGLKLSTGLVTRSFPWSDFDAFDANGLLGRMAIHMWFSPTYRRGPIEGAIVNQFAGTTQEICQALSAWRNRYAHDA